MANTFKKIQTVTVGSGGAANITFSSIPQTYTDLKLVISARGTANFAGLGYFYTILPNNSSSNLSSRYLLGIGTSVSSGTYVPYGYMAASDYTASVFSNSEHYFSNYTSANNKSISSDITNETNASTVYGLALDAGLWSNSSAITSIVLVPGGGNFAQYTTATLYGVSDVTAAQNAYATGGIITYDDTYVYHTFPWSGTFTPTRSLNVDYLVVAGGGGGGSGNTTSGGGGGAGGVRCTVGATGGGGSLESQLAVTAQAYTVTVGAGGAAGVNGNNSVFGSITSTAGGNASSGSGGGANGGSGGGAGSSGGTSWGLGTTNQGYRGGSGNDSGTPGQRNAGGGGGANAVGANGTASVGGNGGAGITTSISGTSTSYGGGGGAGANSGAHGTGGSGGGGNGGGNAGTANRGGGGGGNGNSAGVSTGAAGGSGIVIVRYAR